MNKRNIDFTKPHIPLPAKSNADVKIISIAPVKKSDVLTVPEICQILGVSRSKAYAVIAELNAIQNPGCVISSGTISKTFFMEHLY